jgi:hypothetical protein
VTSNVAADNDAGFTGGLVLSGLGVHGPLLRVLVSDERVRVMPRWRVLALAGIPAFEIGWDAVARIDQLDGPFGGTHGVRLVLRHRGTLEGRRGLARIVGRLARRVALGIGASDAEKLLTLAPATIPRRTQRGLVWWP